ncbi:MAG: thermonuclease family protein, partial [Ktedonobacteraceae bacterium]|nr:thermonuclease family protein [Ktedonobacteraceae bacterium]
EKGSDGDTITVQLDRPFLFQPYPDQPFRETHAFDDAEIRGEAVLHKNNDTGTQSITVRLQGIDAPEIHYRPQAPENLKSEVKAKQEAFRKYNKEYRQLYGETATVQLSQWLRDTRHQQQLDCIVVTQVDTPNDVFDAYGRFIGTIYIPDENGNETVPADDGQASIKAIDVNLHSVQQGWAFPTFYSSMTEEEITTLLQAAKHAQEQSIGLWPLYQSRIGKLDTDLVYDRPTSKHHPAYDATRDTGPIIFPKLFRRLCTYTALEGAGIIDKTFKQFLRMQREYCFLLDEFLEQGPTASTPHPLDKLVSSKEQLTTQPYDLVFQEKASTLRDKNTGQTIKTWW